MESFGAADGEFELICLVSRRTVEMHRGATPCVSASRLLFRAFTRFEGCVHEPYESARIEQRLAEVVLVERLRQTRGSMHV